ncbi:MAG: DUF4406 domain-containing protein [Aeriscardovia sp.]|nr:DUF4406 domain-containing protein [Aeriscardovia sp.]
MSDAFRIFVSLPMRGFDVDSIRKRQKEIFDKAALPEWELIDTCEEDPNADPDNQLWYLGRSIQMLGKADAVIFSNDWRSARGCVAEHLIAEAYGILCLYEE